jgi:hypothetical protein
MQMTANGMPMQRKTRPRPNVEDVAALPAYDWPNTVAEVVEPEVLERMIPIRTINKPKIAHPLAVGREVLTVSCSPPFSLYCEFLLYEVDSQTGIVRCKGSIDQRRDRDIDDQTNCNIDANDFACNCGPWQVSSKNCAQS